jgi:hypothetical protein
MEPFTFDTHQFGNWNTGHEGPLFYAPLTDAERYDVIEFLKTFNDDGDYQFKGAALSDIERRTIRRGAALPAESR